MSEEVVVTSVGDLYLVKAVYSSFVEGLGRLWCSSIYAFNKGTPPSIPPDLMDPHGRRLELVNVTNPDWTEVLRWLVDDGGVSVSVSTEKMRNLLIALSQEESNEGSQVSLNPEDQRDQRD